MRILLSLACAALLAGCSWQADPPPAAAAPASAAPGEITLPPGSPKLQQMKTAAVELAEMPVDEVDAPGKIEVNPNRVSRVVTPVAGRVKEVFVRLGDKVEEGQPVATIESPDADAAISAYLQADSSLGQTKANLLKAQADLDRMRDLLEHQAVAKKDVLNAENLLLQAKAQVEQGAAAREQTLRRLALLGLKPGEFGQKITLRAPVPGKVLEMSAVPGEFRNDTNQTLMTIADLSTVWIASDVPETAIRFVHAGDVIELELSAYPGERFRAHVKRIADNVDATTRTVKVRSELQNAGGRLLPEMFGRIRHLEATRRMPAVPAGAVLQGQNGSYVYIESGPGRFRPAAVRTGNRSGDLLAVLDGVRQGERIVVDGAMLLRQN